MLARYRIVRGRRPPEDPLPDGIRQDTRAHTRHVLRPDKDAVQALLSNPGDAAAWERFATRYRALLEQRHAENREPFDALARLARDSDVYIGCNCPTQKNPDLSHCHTVLALRFLQERYPDLDVVLPQGIR